MLVVNTSCERRNHSKPSRDTVLVDFAVSYTFYTQYRKRTVGRSCSFSWHISFPKLLTDLNEIWYIEGLGYRSTSTIVGTYDKGKRGSRENSTFAD
jgi:hypothetical protein